MFRPVLAAMSVLMGALTGVAADTSFSGTVKQVDAEKGSITVTLSKGEKTFDVLKKAKITVNEKSATLKEVGIGLQANLSYNSDLEVVTAIIAKGKAAAKPEVVELAELSRGHNDVRAHVSGNGKNLVYYSIKTGDNNGYVTLSTRKSVDVLFGEPKSLFAGYDCAISTEGDEIYFMSAGKLMKAIRDVKESTISRPTPVEELADFKLRMPSLCADDLVLFFIRNPLNKGDKFTLWRTTRSDKNAKWEKPQNITFTLDDPTAFFMTVSLDGKLLFTSGRNAEGRSNVIVYSLSKDGKSFEKPRLLDIGGVPFVMNAPRYVPATNELYFDAKIPATNKEIHLYVVRNFDPEIHLVEFKK